MTVSTPERPRTIDLAEIRPAPIEQPAESPSSAPAPRFVDDLRRTLFRVELGAMALLAVGHMVLTWAPAGRYERVIVTLFHVDHEMNLPNWFASTQLGLLALTLFAIAVALRVDAPIEPRRAWPWIACGVAALYLSADEVAAIHERLGTVLEGRLSALPPGSPLRELLRFPSYYWMLVYAPLVVPALIGLALFVRARLGPARRTALLGVFVYLYAAVGLDFIEGRFGNVEHTKLTLLAASKSFAFDIFLMEEMLEMLGVALVLDAFLRHLASVIASRCGPKVVSG